MWLVKGIPMIVDSATLKGLPPTTSWTYLHQATGLEHRDRCKKEHIEDLLKELQFTAELREHLLPFLHLRQKSSLEKDTAHFN